MIMNRILAVILSLFASSAFAGEVINVVYAFGVGDTMANYSRQLIEVANKAQNKYTFIFEAKPGAGGSIASRYVVARPNAILATSGAFFVRPNFFPEASHKVSDFRELLVQTSAPMSASSIKYKSWKEIPADAKINIGVSGLGVVSHLSAVQIMTKFPNATIVPFKSTSDALLTLLSGNLDLAIGFMGEQEQWATGEAAFRVNILGITGPKSINGRATYVSAGFPEVFTQMNNPNHLLAPRAMPEIKFQELRNILYSASRAESVMNTYKIDFGLPLDVPTDKLDAWYTAQEKHWDSVSKIAKQTMKE
jgi:tripartite-type tricarboxylate transporter receptor subunit TctC